LIACGDHVVGGGDLQRWTLGKDPRCPRARVVASAAHDGGVAVTGKRNGLTLEDRYSLGGDGNTAIVGGPADSNSSNTNGSGTMGATWVYTRTNGVWTQQGAKLVGSDAGTALPHRRRERNGATRSPGRPPRLALAFIGRLRPEFHGPIGMVGLMQSFARAEFLPQRCFSLRPVPHPRG